MRLKLPAPLLLGSIVLLACSRIASAHPVDMIPIGYLSYDVTMPGISAVFDITNQTGPNSTPFPDTTWPVTTAASFKISSLTVDFSDGSNTVLGPSYFTLGPDGLSLDGSSLDISGGKPQPTEAVLVGTIANSRITLNDGSNLSVVPPRALVNSTGTGNPVIVHPAGSCCLRDGDSAVIYVATTLPEPVPSDLPIWMLLLTGTLFSRQIRRTQ